MISVGILEDQPLLADAMSAALTGPEVGVRFNAASCAAVLEVIEGDPVDVLIADLAPLAEHRLELARMLQQVQAPRTSMRVLVLSRVLSPEVASLALAPAVVDVLSTTSLGRGELLGSVHAASRGEKRISVDVVAQQGGLRAAPPVHDREILNHLTARERETLHLVGAGYDNLKIAATLGISERTVKAHVAALYRKLDVENRVELALLALRLGSPRPLQLIQG